HTRSDRDWSSDVCSSDLPQSASYQLASLNDRGSDVTGTVSRNPALQVPPRYQPADFPKVDRTLKGDRLVVTPSAPSNEASGPARSEERRVGKEWRARRLA